VDIRKCGRNICCTHNTYTLLFLTCNYILVTFVSDMSRFKKSLARLLSRPKDFTWQELQTIMSHLGYLEKKGGGSRRKFFNPKTKVSISLHEPHPELVLKMYAIDIVIDHLKEEDLI
jgi:hypothetical protein